MKEMVKNSRAIKSVSFKNLWETRTIQYNLAKCRACWDAEGQNEVCEGRDSLGVFEGVSTETFTPIPATDHLCLDGRHRVFSW